MKHLFISHSPITKVMVEEIISTERIPINNCYFGITDEDYSNYLPKNALKENIVKLPDMPFPVFEQMVNKQDQTIYINYLKEFDRAMNKIFVNNNEYIHLYIAHLQSIHFYLAASHPKVRQLSFFEEGTLNYFSKEPFFTTISLLPIVEGKSLYSDYRPYILSSPFSWNLLPNAELIKEQPVNYYYIDAKATCCLDFPNTAVQLDTVFSNNKQFVTYKNLGYYKDTTASFNLVQFIIDDIKNKLDIAAVNENQLLQLLSSKTTSSITIEKEDLKEDLKEDINVGRVSIKNHLNENFSKSCKKKGLNSTVKGSIITKQKGFLPFPTSVINRINNYLHVVAFDNYTFCSQEETNLILDSFIDELIEIGISPLVLKCHPSYPFTHFEDQVKKLQKAGIKTILLDSKVGVEETFLFSNPKQFVLHSIHSSLLVYSNVLQQKSHSHLTLANLGVNSLTNTCITFNFGKLLSLSTINSSQDVVIVEKLQDVIAYSEQITLVKDKNEWNKKRVLFLQISSIEEESLTNEISNLKKVIKENETNGKETCDIYYLDVSTNFEDLFKLASKTLTHLLKSRYTRDSYKNTVFCLDSIHRSVNFFVKDINVQKFFKTLSFIHSMINTYTNYEDFNLFINTTNAIELPKENSSPLEGMKNRLLQQSILHSYTSKGKVRLFAELVRFNDKCIGSNSLAIESLIQKTDHNFLFYLHSLIEYKYNRLPSLPYHLRKYIGKLDLIYTLI